MPCMGEVVGTDGTSRGQVSRAVGRWASPWSCRAGHPRPLHWGPQQEAEGAQVEPAAEAILGSLRLGSCLLGLRGHRPEVASLLKQVRRQQQPRGRRSLACGLRCRPSGPSGPARPCHSAQWRWKVPWWELPVERGCNSAQLWLPSAPHAPLPPTMPGGGGNNGRGSDWGSQGLRAWTHLPNSQAPSQASGTGPEARVGEGVTGRSGEGNSL